MLCDAIDKYDKLRFVVENPSKNKIIGLFELSFGIPQSDIDRFINYGIQLSEATDCRFGPTIADDYQGQGVGSLIFPLVQDVVSRFGKIRITFLGGVRKNNERATHWYKKFGFVTVGEFTGKSGSAALDMILNL